MNARLKKMYWANIGNKELELEFERAVKLLTIYLPIGEDRKKPILMHALRVGLYLYEHDYSQDVVLAGLLHDILEWTRVKSGIIKKEFGEKVLEIVQANTQNRTIKDKRKQWSDSVERCAAVGTEALVVKAADILDSNRFYNAVRDSDEIKRTEEYGRLILSKVQNSANDPLFKKLGSLLSTGN